MNCEYNQDGRCSLLSEVERDVIECGYVDNSTCLVYKIDLDIRLKLREKEESDLDMLGADMGVGVRRC